MIRPQALRWIAPLALLAGSGPIGAADEPPKPAPAGFRVVGYLPEYRLDGFDPAQARGLTELVYFSIEVDPTGALDLGRLRPGAVARLRRAKAELGCSLTLCVGGWDRSAGFPAMAASPEARKRFAGDLVRFCRENGFDGVDLDWEHPKGPKQATDHATLLAEVREAFGPAKLRLSMAVAGWQKLDPRAIAAVDALNLMAYDNDGRHSTFEYATSQVDVLRKQGVPPAKILLGLPFYGRLVDDRSKEMTYAEILRRSLPSPETDETGGFYFNGQKTIERKTRYAIDAGLGGVMIWEVGQDVAGERSLLGSIRHAIETPPPRSAPIGDNRRTPGDQ